MLSRAQAFQHAIDTGEESACIVLGTVQLLWQACQQDKPRYCTEHDLGGLWLYLERLALRYSHAYVAPYGWPHGGYVNQPVIPSVAVYRTKTLRKLKSLEGPIGWNMVEQGYDSFTTKDFMYINPGMPPLVEKGTAKTWSQAYERAISDLL